MPTRDVVIRIRGDIGDLQAKLATLGHSMGSAVDKITAGEREAAKMRQGLNDLGSAAGRIGVAAAAGVGVVVKAAMDWETAWTGVTKTVDGTTAQMAELEQGLRDLAQTLPASHEEIAAVAEAAGQLGVAREDIVSFTKTMIDLGETTNLTADEAATSIAQMANVMGTAPDQIDNLGAALVALGNDGASTERDIIQMAQRISATGAQIGLAESDVLAFANAAASMGIEVEAGGSAISRVFSNMAKAVAQGGPKLEQFAETAGVTSQEFVKAFKDDPAEAFASFTGGLDRINKSGGDVFSLLTSLGMSDIRVSQALLSMASAGDLLTDSLDLGAQAWQDNTALAVEAAKRYDTTAAQVQMSWNRIKDSAIDFGEAALPVVAEAADKIGDLADVIGGLPGPVKSAGVALGGVTAVLGGGLWFTAKTISGVASMREALTNLGIESDKASRAMKGLGVAAGTVAALTALGAAVDSIRGSIADTLPGVEGFTKQLLQLKAVGSLGEDWEGFGAALEGTDGRLGSVAAKADSMLSALGPLATVVRGSTGTLTQMHDSLEKLDAQAELVDTTFTNLVQTAGPDVAGQMFEDFARSTNLSADAQEALLDRMPQYKEALAGIANEADLAAAAAGSLDGKQRGANNALEDSPRASRRSVDAFGDVEDAASDAGAEVEDFGDSVKRVQEILKGRSNLRAYEQSLDDFTKRFKERRDLLKDLTEAQRDFNNAESPEERQSARDRIKDLNEDLKDYKFTLEDGTQAGRDWQAALDEIAGNALTAAESLDELERPAFLQRAREDFIESAMRLGKTRKEAKGLADDLLLLDQTEAMPKIEIDDKPARLTLDQFKQAFYGLEPKTVELHLKLTGAKQLDQLERFGHSSSFDSGGFTGYGGKYEPAGIVHRGEFVFDAETTLRNRALFEAIHRGLPGYAAGGYAERVQTSRVTNYYSGASGLSDSDISRLALAMSKIKPLYGDVHVHGDGSFRRELERDERREAVGGFNFNG